MPLPESIPVKYSEDDAQFISMRPLVRQTFRAAELIDMIVSVAGKDAQRVRQILRSGTVAFHSFRYWWDAFDPDPVALAETLLAYPDSQPSRPFRSEDCDAVLLESPGMPRHRSLLLGRNEASQKRLFRSRSLWDALMEVARNEPPAYGEYSYARRGDTYVLLLDTGAGARVAQAASKFAPRALRLRLANLASISQITFICPRR